MKRTRRISAVVLAMLAAGLAAPQSARPQGSAAPLTNPTPAQPSAHDAFLDGYRAYQNRDYAQAIQRLGAAAASDPVLGDWALYFLGCAQRDSGDLTAAATTFDRLVATYPTSAIAQNAELELARAQLALGHNAEASATAARLVLRGPEPDVESQARLIEVQALTAEGNAHDAYAQAMELRDKFPRAASDAPARGVARTTLAANPTLADTSSFEYLQHETELLLREGVPSQALATAQRALAILPPDARSAEMIWLEAQALRGNTEREKRALFDYLRIAPKGPSAPAVLERLALMYWRDDDTATARATFSRIVAEFPPSHYASGAMLRIGRIFEEEHKPPLARAEYQRLIARYPSSEAGDEARFRAPWMSFAMHHYADAAVGFAQARAHASGAAEHDMYDYWRARALEEGGRREEARELYTRVAESIESNYYPALAARRVDAPEPDLPAARAQDPSLYPLPSAIGMSRFHFDRALAFRDLGLIDLEASELRVLAADAGDSALRQFVLAAAQSAGAWYDAIILATKMLARGELPPDRAERVRFPRAYWDLLSGAATRRGLDPYLVLALTRQESMFNPHATSSSDARGLMQLLPSTGARLSGETGISSANLYDPATNVALGTAYLRKLLDQFGGDEFRAVAAYNGGEHAVQDWLQKFPGTDDEWVENIGYRETRDYVKKVIGNRREYLLLYGPHG